MTTMARKRMLRSQTLFIPDNKTVTPRLKIVLETGEACLLPPILTRWGRDELLRLRKDLRHYYLAASRHLTAKAEEMLHPEHALDARHAMDLRRKYGHQRRALAEACIEIEDEIERALAHAKEAM